MKPFYFSSFTADILEANDSLTQVINLYRQLVKGEEVSADDTTTQQPSMCMCVLSYIFVQNMVNRYALSAPGSALVDLMGLNTSASTAPSNSEGSSLRPLTQNTGISLLDDELAPLGKNKVKKEKQLACKYKCRRASSLQAKKKKKKEVSSVCTARGHIWSQHKKNAPFMTTVHTIPDVMKHKMVQKHKAINYNKMYGFSLFLGLSVTENCVSQDVFQVRLLRNCPGRT